MAANVPSAENLDPAEVLPTLLAARSADPRWRGSPPGRRPTSRPPQRGSARSRPRTPPRSGRCSPVRSSNDARGSGRTNPWAAAGGCWRRRTKRSTSSRPCCACSSCSGAWLTTIPDAPSSAQRDQRHGRDSQECSRPADLSGASEARRGRGRELRDPCPAGAPRRSTVVTASSRTLRRERGLVARSFSPDPTGQEQIRGNGCASCDAGRHLRLAA